MQEAIPEVEMPYKLTSTDEAPDAGERRADRDTAIELLLGEFEQAGREHALLAGREKELEADRAGEWLNAVRRIMQRENELTGKPHSASSADAVVETDHEYRAFLRAQQEIVTQKLLAHTKKQSAEYRIQQLIADLKNEANIR